MKTALSLLPSRLFNQRGMSLLEVTLGMMILAVGLLGLYPIMSNATSKTLQSDNHISATYLANAQIETILADSAFRGFDYVTSDAYPLEDLGGGFTRSTAITEVNIDDLSTASENSGYKKVEVTVFWGNAPNERIVLTTLLTER